MNEPSITLKVGKDKSVLRAHPWIFSGAIETASADIEPGQTVRVLDASGTFLARAAYSPKSQIRARVWTTNPDEAIDEAFLLARIDRALARRRPLAGKTSAVRIVHSEADGVPGLIADRYGDVVVAQFLSAGANAWRGTLARLLARATGCRLVYERSDADVRELEGLDPVKGPLVGSHDGSLIPIDEYGVPMQVDIVTGHKTGFYIDQRENRRLVREDGGQRVLNCFCYTGGFSIAARQGGAAEVLSIDSSADAISLARRNASLAKADGPGMQWHCADVFSALRELRNAGRTFDTIILDPPKFAPTAAHAAKATRAYKDINILAAKMLAPGARLYTFSCSGGISAELFQKIVAGAASDARRELVIEARLGAGPDHPIALSFPEGEYLKGLKLVAT